MTEKNNLPPSLLQHIPWEIEKDSIWLSSSFLLKRNLGRYYFPPKMSEGQMLQVIDIFKEALFKRSELQQPLLLRAETLSGMDKEFLFEHFLCPESFQNTLSGQAFIIDASSRFFAQINIQDHLQLQLTDAKGEWEQVWNTLSKLDTDLAASLEFAFSPRFGYLTADPANCGTALRATCYLHVSALVHTGQLQEAILKQKEENIEASGILGNMEELVGDLLVLRNRYTLGMTEENFLHSLHATAMKLALSERTIRTHLQQTKSDEMKDHVSRSYGLLVHSYQLQTKEALNALSLLKLGVDLGWVEGISPLKINALFFQSQRAHLSYLFPDQPLDQAEMARKRAEYLHQQTQDVKLKI